MLTFRLFVSESTIRTAASIGLAAKIAGLSRQIQQARGATKTEKNLASEIAWLAALSAAIGLTEDKR